MAKSSKTRVDARGASRQQGGREYVSQSDVPSVPLINAVKIAKAIADNYASKPVRPIAVAEALGMQPTTGSFRMLCGASIAYGLTNGGYNAEQISLTALGRRAVSPLQEGDDSDARREAVLQPRVPGDFLRRYDGSKVPRDEIAHNVLVEMGVPRHAVQKVFELILENAETTGLLRSIGGNRFVDLSNAVSPIANGEVTVEEPIEEAIVDHIKRTDNTVKFGADAPPKNVLSAVSVASNKVFVTHGKNRTLLAHLKELLAYGQFEPVVSIDRESTSKPVPEKVLDDMRACAAAIIHVDAERELTGPDGETVVSINENVLIEIGAAMALYNKRFILLVKEGVKLPSNLQGLYEVRYAGDKLDGEATLRLLKAFSGFRGTT